MPAAYHSIKLSRNLENVSQSLVEKFGYSSFPELVRGSLRFIATSPETHSRVAFFATLAENEQDEFDAHVWEQMRLGR